MRPNLLVFLFATSCIFLSVSLAYADDSFLKRHEDKEQSNDSFHKCVERIKEYMQEKPSFAIDIESNMPALEAFFKRVEKGRSQKSYSINKSNEFVTEIKYQESLDSDHNKFEMMYKLEDLVDKDLPPEHNYAHKLSLKVEMNAISSGNIVHSLTQKYLINNVDVCGPLLAEVEYVDYLFNANEGSKTYRVQGSGAKLHKRNKSFEKINFVHQSAFASCPSDFEGISKDFVQPNEVKECFLAEGFFDNIRYSLSEPRIISGFDPILKKQVDFKVNAIKMFFYDEQVNFEQYKSTQSDFKIEQSSLSPNEKEEKINLDLWRSVSFLKEKIKNADPSIRFALLKTGSKYRFDSPVPLVFDNYIGYYRLLRSLEQGKSEYVVELSDQYLMERFLDFSDKPLQLGVSESFKNYLEPTKFIDFMEPAIQRLIAELRKKIGPNTTQFEFIQLLLSEVNSQLVFDSTMEADDTVTTISASDTLKRKSGVCQHFAALFSALSRGLGIPARIINGYHQSSNWDGSVIKGNHAWVEILVDGSKWLPIEPQQKSFEFISSSYLPIAVNPLYEQKDSAKMSDILKSSLSIFRIIKDLHILEIHENEGVRAPYFNHSHEL